MLNALGIHQKVCFGFCVLWAVILMYQAQFCGFVLDDVYLIVQNRWLSQESGLTQILSSDLWSGEPHPDKSTGYYRPLFLLSVWFDYQMWGANPFGYHFQSIVWHFLSSLFLLRLLLKWNLPAAYLASMIFLVHPLQTEILFWVSARNDSMAMSFALLAVLCWSRESSLKADLLGAFLLLLALGSKESALFVFPFILALGIFKKLDLPRIRVVILVLVLGVFFLTRHLSDITLNWPSYERWSFLFGQLPQWVTYMFGRLLVPDLLSSHMPIGWLEIDFTWVIGSLMLLLLFAVVIRYRSWQWAALSFICIIFSVGLVLPSMAQHGLIGDRYLSVAVFGLSILVSLSTGNIKSVLLPVVVLFASLSVMRSNDWKSDKHIWQAHVDDYPTSFGTVSLAHIYFNERNYQQAYDLYLSGYSMTRPYLNACDAFVVSAMKSQGLLVANEKGSWALQEGCRLTGELAGIMGVVNIGMREWGAAQEMCNVAAVDFYRRKDLVCSAIDYVSGNMFAIEQRRSTWSNVKEFDQQLSTLLISGGLKP